MWQADRMLEAHRGKVAHLRDEVDAAQLLLTGLGYDLSWRPENWIEAAERVVTDESRYLAEADLYVLSPQMCDVVIAAAQSLTTEDLALLASDDLPSLTGLVMLPQPQVLREINGNLADLRALHWRAPTTMLRPNAASQTWIERAAVRIASYQDSYGPVRPDSFLQFTAYCRGQGFPLPPLLLDGIQCVPFEEKTTEQQRQDLDQFLAAARRLGEHDQARRAAAGANEERVIGEYEPGSEIVNTDGTFPVRFLYAFWRLCAQEIAVTSPAEVRHAARLAAEKAGVSADVRVTQLRTATKTSAGDPDQDSTSRWNHRWVVRMHKVRQWYPSEQRHKVLYRGPYVKGPDDKPLLGGDVVRSLTR